MADTAHGLPHEALAQEPFEAAARWFAEPMRFAGRRADAYAQFMTKLVQCRDPGDLLNAQAAFAAATLQDYRREAEKFMNLGAVVEKTRLQAPH